MVVITGNGNTSKQWKHLTMATPQTIYTIALNTLETHLTTLPLDNDIIGTQWHKYNRDLNYQWKKTGIGQHR